MPQKKKTTTLVTEDELMDAVTARVTDNIRRELDDRFATFRKILDRMAPAPPAAASQSSPTRSNKRPAEDQPQPQPSATRYGMSVLQDQDVCHIDSSNSGIAHPAPSASARTPQVTITRDSAELVTSRPEVMTLPGSNVNNNNATWTAWQAAQQPFSSQQSGFPGAILSGDQAATLEDQVRYIMETTPNQFKGKLPSGGFLFPYKYVTRGPEKRKLSFNTVTLAEHIYGMFRMIDDQCTDPAIKPSLVVHMREVAEDACEYEWNTHVRRWSEEVFSMIAEKKPP